MPCDISRRVVVDLLEGDLAKKELELLQQKLHLTEQIVISQNDIITSHRVKVQAYNDQIRIYEQKEVLYGGIVAGLEKDKRGLKRTVKFLGISLGVVSVATLVGFLLN